MTCSNYNRANHKLKLSLLGAPRLKPIGAQKESDQNYLSIRDSKKYLPNTLYSIHEKFKKSIFFSSSCFEFNTDKKKSCLQYNFY